MMSRSALAGVSRIASTTHTSFNKILAIHFTELLFEFGLELMRSAQRLFAISGEEQNQTFMTLVMRHTGFLTA
jgi:hypothetical protein